MYRCCKGQAGVLRMNIPAATRAILRRGKNGDAANGSHNLDGFSDRCIYMRTSSIHHLQHLVAHGNLTSSPLSVIITIIILHDHHHQRHDGRRMEAGCSGRRQHDQQEVYLRGTTAAVAVKAWRTICAEKSHSMVEIGICQVF